MHTRKHTCKCHNANAKCREGQTFCVHFAIHKLSFKLFSQKTYTNPTNIQRFFIKLYSQHQRPCAGTVCPLHEDSLNQVNRKCLCRRFDLFPHGHHHCIHTYNSCCQFHLLIEITLVSVSCHYSSILVYI